MTIDELEKWAFTNGHPDQWWISIDEGDVSGPMSLSAVRKLAKKYTRIAIMNDAHRDSDNPVWATIAPDAEAVKCEEKAKADKEQAKVNKGCGIVFLSVLVIILFSMFLPDRCKSSDSAPDTGDALSAWVMGQQFLENHLKSPGTAKYPGNYRDHVSGSGNSYTVRAWVDAQNSFGATLRQRWVARVTYTGGDNWRCDYLELDGQILIGQ